MSGCGECSRAGLEPDGLVELIEQASVVVEPEDQLAVVRDAADNRLLEAAITGHASAVVTGDDDLLAIGGFAGIEILTPAAMAHRLSALADV